MANILTTDQAAIFSRPELRDDDWQRVGYLIHQPTATAIDITSRVESFGTVRVEVYNPNPRKRGRLDYPRMSWKLNNPDGYFTPGHAFQVWKVGVVEYEPQEWRAQYNLTYVGGEVATHTRLTLSFDVLEIQLEEEAATLISIHQLARAWSRRWDREDRHATDWGAVPHTVTL